MDQKDIIGGVVNLVCKIQRLAPVGEIALGHVTLQNLHTHWRLICTEIETGQDWEYIDQGTHAPYRVHQVRFT